MDGYFKKALFPDYLKPLNGKLVAENSLGQIHWHGTTPESPSSSPGLTWHTAGCGMHSYILWDIHCGVNSRSWVLRGDYKRFLAEVICLNSSVESAHVWDSALFESFSGKYAV